MNRVVATIQRKLLVGIIERYGPGIPGWLIAHGKLIFSAASDEIEAIEAEIEAELQDELEPPKEKRWIAFAPTSYHQCKTY